MYVIYNIHNNVKYTLYIKYIIYYFCLKNLNSA